MEIIIVGALICAGIGYTIDNGRGAILGGILGPIGLLITAILRNSDAKANKD